MQIKNVRFIIAAITTFSAYAVYVSRVNLSIAIIAMVEDGHQQHQTAATSQAAIVNGTSTADHLQSRSTAAAASDNSNTNNYSSNSKPPLGSPPNESSPDNWLASPSNRTNGWPAISGLDGVQANGTIGSNLGDETDKLHREPLSTIFPASKKSVKTPLISQEKFHWDQTEQGHVLGAFFYGYILFQIPGARMAESVGAKWIIMAANAGSALISLLFPMSTQLNSIHLLMVLRFVMGLCQSAFFPAAYVLFCRWLPEKERAILLPIMFIGSNMGSISTYIMSSYLISSSHGWPSVFYVSGLICALVTVMWCVFGSNGPSDNWLITEEERHFIEGNVNNQSSERNSLDGHHSSHHLHHHHQQQHLGQLVDRKSCCNSRRSSISLRGRLNSRCSIDLRNSLMNSKQNSLQLIKLDQQANNNNHNTCGGPAALLDQDRDNNNNNTTATIIKGADDAHLDQLEDHNMTALDYDYDHDHDHDEDESTSDSCRRVGGGQLSWPKLLGSIPVWTLILSMYGNEWSNAVLCYELPTYLNTALNIPIEQNGVLNSFFQLSYTLVSPVISSLGAHMLDRHLFGMRKIHIRKLFQSLATFGQLACFVSVPICGANRGLIIMFMFSAVVFKACANAGDIMVSGDLSPEYAGTIFAFANSIGNTAGFFVPILAGAFVRDAYERDQWTPFWMTTAAIMGCSGLIFLVFGQTARQNFARDPDEPLDLESAANSDGGELSVSLPQLAHQAAPAGKTTTTK